MLALLLVVLVLSFAPPSAAACAGDCGGDGEVSIDELLVGVNIGLGSAPVERCSAIDSNGDREVTIDEIIAAVNAALTGCPVASRLIAVGREGQIAALDLSAPWSVRGSNDLHATISSARCRAGRCLIVHPSPSNALSVVAAADVSLLDTITFAKNTDPRDVAFIDDQTVVISQYGSAELIELDLATHHMTAIDLSPLADADGLPESLRLAVCGHRVFAQLQRIDHESGAPAAIGAALAVIDLDQAGAGRIVDADPNTPGVQGIALAGRPNFDMPVDCAAGTLYVAEPAPLFQGGGDYEQVDLSTLSARQWPVDTGAQVGGFEVVRADLYWLITHTDIGPGPSSHLNQFGGLTTDTYNTFATEHIDDLALDRATGLLFFPDACDPRMFSACDTGIHVFDANSGAQLTTSGIKVGFAPIEVAVSN